MNKFRGKEIVYTINLPINYSSTEKDERTYKINQIKYFEKNQKDWEERLMVYLGTFKV